MVLQTRHLGQLLLMLCIGVAGVSTKIHAGGDEGIGGFPSRNDGSGDGPDGDDYSGDDKDEAHWNPGVGQGPGGRLGMRDSFPAVVLQGLDWTNVTGGGDALEIGDITVGSAAGLNGPLKMARTRDGLALSGSFHVSDRVALSSGKSADRLLMRVSPDQRRGFLVIIVGQRRDLAQSQEGILESFEQVLHAVAVPMPPADMDLNKIKSGLLGIFGGSDLDFAIGVVTKSAGELHTGLFGFSLKDTQGSYDVETN